MPGILETLVLDHLRPKGSNRWWLPPLLLDQLEQQLRVAFAQPRLPSEEMIRLLKLIAVFEADEAYREVAEQMIAVLRSIPEAVARIEAWRGRSAIDPRLRERLSRFVSREETMRAPRIDEGPVSGVRLKDLAPPIDPVQMRVRSSDKTTRRGG
jgi:hypothetical protein